MVWLLKILFDNKLKAKERAYRLKLMKENQLLISEIRKLKLLIRSNPKQKNNPNQFLEIIKKSNLDQLIFSLEIGNRAINFLWVPRTKVDILKRFSLYTRLTLNQVINLAGLVGSDFYENKSKTNSIFNPIRQQIDLENFDFSFEKFESKVSSK